MRLQLAEPSILIELHIFGVVDGVKGEWIHRDQDRAHVRVDMAFLEANLGGGENIRSMLFNTRR